MRAKPEWYSELVIDQTDLPLDDYRVWTDATPETPCAVLGSLGELCVILTEKMNELEPGQDNHVFLRVPIEL
jgi:hypothetical protein